MKAHNGFPYRRLLGGAAAIALATSALFVLVNLLPAARRR